MGFLNRLLSKSQGREREHAGYDGQFGNSKRMVNDERFRVRPAIIFPLYIYPENGAWEPLFDMVVAHPRLDFILIINPHNGPGGTSLDADYSRDLRRLKQYPNATTIGYVRTDYCRRSVDDVVQDIRTYACWDEEFRIDGVFFDETPNLVDEAGKNAVYLDKIARAVKKTPGIGGDRMVINNPGTVPALGLQSSNIDVWTVCEDSFARWQTQDVQEWMATCRYPWEQRCYMVHSASISEVPALVRTLRAKGRYIFVTDLTTDFYAGFGQGWRDFCKTMVD